MSRPELRALAKPFTESRAEGVHTLHFVIFSAEDKMRSWTLF